MKASGASVYYGNTTTAERQSIPGGESAATGTVITVSFFTMVEDGGAGVTNR
jgi:stage V sporulation protein D (sporulation-specific penicillin-binding protein)